MKLKNLSIIGLVIALISILAISSSYANNTRHTEFTSYYPNATGTKLDSCATCHNPELYNLGGRQGNFYARDFKNANYNFSAIEGLDSDGDGISNIDEIIAKTFPGDINDFPTSTNTTTTTTTTSTSTTTTTTTIQQQNGEILYQNYCVSCHGEFGEGGISGEDIRGESNSDIREAIIEINSMNWLNLLTVNETKQISRYLQTLDENNEDDNEQNNGTHTDNNENMNPNRIIKILNKSNKLLENIIKQIEKLNLPEDIQQSIFESLNSTITHIDEAKNQVNTNDVNNSSQNHIDNHNHNEKTTYRNDEDDETSYKEKHDDDDEDERD